MTDSLFDIDELEESALSVYRIGSWWEIKHHSDGGDHKYTSRGQVIAHGTFDNQWRIDYQANQEDRVAPVEEHIVEPELRLWEGRHWQSALRIRLSLITSAQLLTGPEIRERQAEAQAWVDTWIWTDEVWANVGPARHGLDDEVWTPTYTPGRICTHDVPEWRWSRTLLHGASCDYCHATLDDVKLPALEEYCLWWAYHGSMGRGRPPTGHPDDCSFCQSRMAK